MDFTRWGTCGASPRFREGHLLKHAQLWAVPVKGREHHEEWYRTVNHPDALLIAAAPDLLAACQTLIQVVEQLIPEPSARGVANVVLAQARMAVAKASIADGAVVP